MQNAESLILTILQTATKPLRAIDIYMDDRYTATLLVDCCKVLSELVAEGKVTVTGKNERDQVYYSIAV